MICMFHLIFKIFKFIYYDNYYYEQIILKKIVFPSTSFSIECNRKVKSYFIMVIYLIQINTIYVISLEEFLYLWNFQKDIYSYT